MYFHVSHTLFASAVAEGGGGRLDSGDGGGDGPPALRMLEVGQEAEFYMVDVDLMSMQGGGGGVGRLAARIVRPLPQGSVVFERAVAAGAMSVVEDSPSGGGSQRGVGRAAVRVVLIGEVVDRDDGCWRISC